MLVDKNLQKRQTQILNKKMSANLLHSLQEVMTGSKSNCEKHAGSDERFQNITLFLVQLPLKIQFTKEK